MSSLKTIDGYTVEKLLGEGAAGRVYLVRLPGRQRFAALKLLRGNVDPGEIIRFRREFTSILRCQHPNIVSVYGMGEFQGSPYYLMEYLKGDDFLTEMRRGLRTHAPIPDSRIAKLVDIGCQVMDALHYLHSHKTIHRDLKPANIIVTSDKTVKLLDFGLIWDPGTAVENGSGGTAGYLSPEQIRRGRVDPRSDLYAFGICFYEALCGVHPFGLKGDWTQILTRQLDGNFTVPSKLHPDLKDRFDHVMERLLAVNPVDRYQTAGQVFLSLRRLEPGTESELKRGTGDSWGLLETEWIDSHNHLEKVGKWLSQTVLPVLAVQGPSRSGRSRLLEETQGIVPHDVRQMKIDFNRDRELVSVAGGIHRFLLEALGGSSVGDKDLIEKYLKSEGNESERSPMARRAAFIDAFKRYPGLFGPESRVLILIDNLDRSEGLVRELMESLISHATENLRIIYTCDPDYVHPIDSLSVISWKAYDVIACTHFLKRVLGVEKITKKVASKMTHLAEGNLGRLHDILNAWIQEDVLFFQDETWFVGSPLFPEPLVFPTLNPVEQLRPVKLLTHALVMKDRLDREMLRTLAVYGRPCPFSIITKLFAAREELLLEVLDRLIKTGWIGEDIEGDEALFHFCDPEMRGEIYRGISPFHRSYLHHRIADVSLKKKNYPKDRQAFLGEHYSCSDVPVMAIDYLKMAGLTAQRRFDYQNAIRYFDLTKEICLKARENRVNPFPCPPGMMIGYDGIAANDLMNAYFNAREFMAKTYDELWMWAANEKGQICSLRGDYGMAFEEFQRMLTKAREISSRPEEGRALRFIGQVLFHQKKFEEAQKHFENSLSIRSELKDDKGVADCLNALGAIAQRMDKLDEAEKYFLNALDVIRVLKDERGIAYMMNNLGNIQFLQKNYKKALANFTQSYKILEKQKDHLGMAYSAFNAGEVYRTQENYVKANEYLQICLSLRLKIEDTRGSAICYRTLGETHEQMGKRAEAVQYLQKAAELYREMSNQKDVDECIHRINEISQSKNTNKK
jgi:serine/threonine protein kinase/tetratricopeptide (TPR) repeat protein